MQFWWLVERYNGLIHIFDLEINESIIYRALYFRKEKENLVGTSGAYVDDMSHSGNYWFQKLPQNTK